MLTERTLNEAPLTEPAWPKTRGAPVVLAFGRETLNAANVKLEATSNAPPPSPLHHGPSLEGAAGVPLPVGATEVVGLGVE